MPKNAETDFLNEVMGFDTNNLSIFDEAPKTESNPKIYRTNPVKLSKSEDGHYHAKIRILYNPFNIRESIVKSVKYNMRDADGFFQADSKLAINDKKCPIFVAWKKLHFAKKADGTPDAEKDEWSKKMFEKQESKWVLIQVIEDENQPEAVGQFKAWKLPFTIWEKLEAKMHPSPDSKKTPVPLMDYVFGPILDLDVTPGEDDPKHPERKEREISYSLCEFEADPTPIISIDGTQLFEDDEIEFIEKYAKAKATVVKPKVQEKTKAAAQKFIDDNVDALKEIYKKSLAYMKENAFDILEECGYKEWDAVLTARVNSWLEKVSKMIDPAADGTASDVTPVIEEQEDDDPFTNVVNEEQEEIQEDFVDEQEDEDDLPF